MLRNLPDMFCILATTTWENPETGIYVGYAGFTFHNLAHQKVLDEHFATRAFRQNINARYEWLDKNPDKFDECPIPNMLFDENAMFEEYGMCDDYQQILDKWPSLVTDEREYLIHLVPIKSDPDAGWGGFRPHKNGSYIGVHEAVRQHEYFDHSGVDMIYLYHIYRFPLEGEDLRW